MSRARANLRPQQFLLLLLVTLFGSQLVSDGIAQINGQIVSVTLNGRHQIRGQTEQTLYENRSYFTFKGIPYGEAPVGRLRFRPPVAKTMPQTYDAFNYGSYCRQQLEDSSEDCLFLNVFTPSTLPSSGLSVIVFVPGGAFRAGGVNDRFGGADFIVEKDVVLVTLNYRLGAFGFMSLGTHDYSGNMGLKDQQLALVWVHRHIRQFGGDPQRVTLLGGSAGAASAHLQLLATPNPRGLFQRIILMSASAGNYWSVSTETNHQHRMMDMARKQNVSVNSLPELVTWLQNVPSSVILAEDSLRPVVEVGAPNNQLAWAPVVADGRGEQFVVRDDIVQHLNRHNVDMLIGFNSDEHVSQMGHWYNNPAAFNNLQNAFKLALPFKTWTEDRNATAYNEVMSAVRKFYFGDAEIGIDAFEQVVALMSDMEFIYGVDRSVRHQAAYSRGQTFYYQFSANTTLNMIKRLSNTSPLLLAAHGDEICYIFRCSIFPNIYDNLTPESIERRVQINLVNMWTDFAKFGHPTPRGIPINFPPVTANNNRRLVNIGNDGVSDIDNPKWAANRFWDAIYAEHSDHF